MLSRTTDGHDNLFLHDTNERGRGVGDLLVDTESDIYRFDVGFGGMNGCGSVEVAEGRGFRLFFLWGDDENVWHLYRVEGGGWDGESR